MAAEYPHLPAPCPCCGAYSLAPDQQVTSLLAVCDVLVFKALEAMGKFIVRAERSRFRTLGSRPFHEAHTLWQASDEIVSKALKNAWDVVPPLVDIHGCCGITSLQVTHALNEYVHDLVVSGTEHSMDDLAYRFETRLGLEVRRHAHTSR